MTARPMAPARDFRDIEGLSPAISTLAPSTAVPPSTEAVTGELDPKAVSARP